MFNSYNFKIFKKVLFEIVKGGKETGYYNIQHGEETGYYISE